MQNVVRRGDLIWDQSEAGDVRINSLGFLMTLPTLGKVKLQVSPPGCQYPPGYSALPTQSIQWFPGPGPVVMAFLFITEISYWAPPIQSEFRDSQFRYIYVVQCRLPDKHDFMMCFSAYPPWFSHYFNRRY